MNKVTYYWKCTIVAGLFFLVLGFVTLILWNWLVPTLFNGPLINYAQALGLLLLCKILFGGLLHRKGHHHHNQTPYWKQRFQEKLSTLDPVEREAFKNKMKEKWCRWERQDNDDKHPSND